MGGMPVYSFTGRHFAGASVHAQSMYLLQSGVPPFPPRLPRQARESQRISDAEINVDQGAAGICGLFVCMQTSRDFSEHDSETTGSERAQQEHEDYVYTRRPHARLSVSAPQFTSSSASDSACSEQLLSNDIRNPVPADHKYRPPSYRPH